MSFLESRATDELVRNSITHSFSHEGLTENAGRDNDGPSKLQGMKLMDMKLMDQCAGREIAGRENDGPICRTRNCRT